MIALLLWPAVLLVVLGLAAVAWLAPDGARAPLLSALLLGLLLAMAS